MTTAPLSLRDGFLDDYDALRRGAGAVRCEREVLRVHGPDALEYMQGQCSQDLDPLAAGESTDALLLEPQGKLDALIRVTKSSGDELIVDVAGGYGQVVRSRLERFKLRVKAEIEPLSWKCIAVRGPRSTELFESYPHENRMQGSPDDSSRSSLLVLGYSWNGLEGFDLLGEDPAIPEGVRECGADALEALRVEAGIPEMGAELDERTIPAEAQLLERCVSFTKGCYTGQELVARLDARGNRVARHLRGLVLDSDAMADVSEIASSVVGSEVALGDKVVGGVTSAVWSPALGAVAALGYVHRSITPPAAVDVRPTSSAATETSEVRPVHAEVRELPLV